MTPTEAYYHRYSIIKDFNFDEAKQEAIMLFGDSHLTSMQIEPDIAHFYKHYKAGSI